MLFSEIKKVLNETDLPDSLDTPWMMFNNLPLAVSNRINRLELLINEHGVKVGNNPEARSIKSELIHIINNLTDKTNK